MVIYGTFRGLMGSSHLHHWNGMDRLDGSFMQTRQSTFRLQENVHMFKASTMLQRLLFVPMWISPRPLPYPPADINKPRLSPFHPKRPFVSPFPLKIHWVLPSREGAISQKPGINLEARNGETACSSKWFPMNSPIPHVLYALWRLFFKLQHSSYMPFCYCARSSFFEVSLSWRLVAGQWSECESNVNRMWTFGTFGTFGSVWSSTAIETKVENETWNNFLSQSGKISSPNVNFS